MARDSLSDALRPLAGRLGRAVREHEVLHVAATVGGTNPAAAAEQARKEVLAWAQKRCGGRLPPEAWELASFEYLSGGRNSVGVRIQSDVADVWAIRADDPDKSIPGRIWTTEVIVGLIEGQQPRFSVRLLASTDEEELLIEPHTPGFIQQVAEACGLRCGTYDVQSVPWSLDSVEHADRLAHALADPSRRLPVFVLTIPNGNGGQPLVNADVLARATLGIGHVVVLPSELSWALTSRFGRIRSVFGGAVRAYLPGFNEMVNPYAHRLVLSEQLREADGRNSCLRWMRLIAAAESIRQNRLGIDVLTFATVRNASLRARQEQLTARGASDSEQLVAAKARISALEKQIDDEKALQEYFDNEFKRSEERAATSEAQHRASVFRIHQLQDQLRLRGADLDSIVAPPVSWSELANWIDIGLAGRTALAPAARRGIRSPEFDDLALVVRCIEWLANHYREGRLNGANGSFLDTHLESGVRNSPCGGDEFDFDWQGRGQTADWHIKNNGNTRDPRRCLRIYYFWDSEMQQVVIADLPAHRSSIIS